MPTCTRIPLLYHPTNVVLLDDDRRFLNDLSLALEENIPYVLDDDPRKIMRYLEMHAYQSDALSELVTKQIFGQFEDQPDSAEMFSIDFSRLRETLALPIRFKKCTVGLIDRRMKKMDGLDFCRTVREQDFLFKMILFTGQTDFHDAIQAFNEKVIDGYLVKGKEHNALIKKVNAMIREYAWQQFVDLGKNLTGLLSHILKPLADVKFINIFDRVRQQHDIVEFYLLDSSCSFLMLDAKGKAIQLFVRNEADFKDCYDIAKDSEAPYDVLQALRARQMFPFTKNAMGYSRFQGDAWDEVMVAMEKIPGRELYFKIMDRPDIEVYPFEKYLNEEWPRP